MSENEDRAIGKVIGFSADGNPIIEMNMPDLIDTDDPLTRLWVRMLREKFRTKPFMEFSEDGQRVRGLVTGLKPPDDAPHYIKDDDKDL